MDSNSQKNIIPYYCTLPLLQANDKTKEGNVPIPDENNVEITKNWSEELKL